MPRVAKRVRRPRPRRAYLIFFILFALIVFVSHAALVTVPFFWDEVGYFIPAALDFRASGALVPHSATPNAHPPGVMAYLAAVWAVFGYSIPATRLAMLLIGAAGVLAGFLLAIELCREVQGVPALLVAALLLCSPTVFAQSMLAQLDMPAMVVTTCALFFFLREKILLSVVTCAVLVMVKETGAIVPLALGGWLLIERRAKSAALFLLPLALLSLWLTFLAARTGHLFGGSQFADYNLRYLWHPVRILIALARRLYHLLVEDFRWIGTAGLAIGWTQSAFDSRSWRVAGWVAAMHVTAFSVLGGAMLERYLLPVLPVVYSAMAAGWAAGPTALRNVAPLAMAVGLIAGNFWNPPYPFPLENNLAFVDFARLDQVAAEYVEQRFPNSRIATAWPLSSALTRREFGYVTNGRTVVDLPDFSADSLAGLDRNAADVFLLYSRQWDPPTSLMRFPLAQKFWQRFFDYHMQVSGAEIDERLGLNTVAGWSRRGQWIEVHARSQPLGDTQRLR